MGNEIINEISKELNIFQKKLFRKYLIDAITRDVKEDFENVVHFIGIQWGVIRTVLSDDKAKCNECNQNPTEEENLQEAEVIKKMTFKNFVDNLWKSKKKILSGEYTDWTKEGQPHSYESKICFLINPKHYKVIFDSQNRKSLKKSKCKAEEWQDIVNKYFEDNKLDSLSIDEIFLNDCNLWLKGKKLKEGKKGKN